MTGIGEVGRFCRFWAQVAFYSFLFFFSFLSTFESQLNPEFVVNFLYLDLNAQFKNSSMK
jgi:hypothetical protein